LPKKVYGEDESVAQIENSAMDFEGSPKDLERIQSLQGKRGSKTRLGLSKGSLTKVEFGVVKK
jgi:hypothetical protein